MRSLMAVSSDITLELLCVAVGVKCPDESLVPAMTVGVTRIPLLAIVANTLVAYIAVREYP